MRRTLGILFISFSLSGLWGQLWHTLGLSFPPGHHRIIPACGGGGSPDGCPPGTPPH
jgi:hypothetical protein